MDATNNYQDLTALLATLSSYAPPPAVTGQQTHNLEAPPPQDPNAILSTLLVGGQQLVNQSQAVTPSSYADYYPQQYAPAVETGSPYDPSNAALTQNHWQGPPVDDHPHLMQQYDPSMIHNQASSQHFIPQPQRTTTTSQPKPSTPQVNPRTITTWPAAIRHVTFLATQAEHLAASIRKLIANQHENERQWHGSRLALLEKQKARVAGKRELENVLRSVGAVARVAGTGGGMAGDDKTDIQELQLYDRKVHRAAVQMSKAMTADLETLGVPFFGIEPGLIFDDDAGEDGCVGISWKGIQKEDAAKPNRRGEIGKNELRTLQRRMISHLEDMYKD